MICLNEKYTPLIIILIYKYITKICTPLTRKYNVHKLRMRQSYWDPLAQLWGCTKRVERKGGRCFAVFVRRRRNSVVSWVDTLSWVGGWRIGWSWEMNSPTQGHLTLYRGLWIDWRCWEKNPTQGRWTLFRGFYESWWVGWKIEKNCALQFSDAL